MCFLSTSLCPAVNKAKISVYAVASYNLEHYKTQLGSVTGTALKAPRGWLPSVKVPVRKLASVPTAPGRPEEFQTQDHSSSSPRTVHQAGQLHRCDFPAIWQRILSIFTFDRLAIPWQNQPDWNGFSTHGKNLDQFSLCLNVSIYSLEGGRLIVSY